MSDLKDFDDPNSIAKTYEVKMKDYTGPMIYESPDGGKTVRARPLNLSNLSSNGTDKMIDYKFNEGELIDEFKRYVNSTYDSHYSKEQFQATEFIIDGGHGTGFCIGNVLKYAQRYGKKGSDKDARKDLMKVLHYTLMQLYIHDSTKST